MATQTEVAKHLDITPEWLRKLIKKGVLTGNNARGGLDVDSLRIQYINYLRNVKNGQADSIDEAEPDEIRDAKIKRKTLETKLRKENYQLSVLENKFAPIEIITETLLRVSQSWSIRLESFSAQIKLAWPSMPPEAKEEIDNIIAEGANELADLRPDISDFPESAYEGDSSWLESIADGET